LCTVVAFMKTILGVVYCCSFYTSLFTPIQAYETEVRGRGKTIDTALDGIFKSWKDDSPIPDTKKTVSKIRKTIKGRAKVATKDTKKTKGPHKITPKRKRTAKVIESTINFNR